ncbi:hypothetical protein ACFL5G_04110 [Candidatus Margulisiibacteriota bacterium]
MRKIIVNIIVVILVILALVLVSNNKIEGVKDQGQAIPIANLGRISLDRLSGLDLFADFKTKKILPTAWVIADEQMADNSFRIYKNVSKVFLEMIEFALVKAKEIKQGQVGSMTKEISRPINPREILASLRIVESAMVDAPELLSKDLKITIVLPELKGVLAKLKRDRVPANTQALVQPLNFKTLPHYQMFAGLTKTNVAKVAEIKLPANKINEIKIALKIPNIFSKITNYIGQKVPANKAGLVQGIKIETLPGYKLFAGLNKPMVSGVALVDLYEPERQRKAAQAVKIDLFAGLKRERVPANAEELAQGIKVEELPGYEIIAGMNKPMVSGVALVDLAEPEIQKKTVQMVKLDLFAGLRRERIPANTEALAQRMNIEEIPGYAMIAGMNKPMVSGVALVDLYEPEIQRGAIQIKMPILFAVVKSERVPANTEMLVQGVNIKGLPGYEILAGMNKPIVSGVALVDLAEPEIQKKTVQMVKLDLFAGLKRERIPANTETIVDPMNIEVLPAYALIDGLRQSDYLAQDWQRPQEELVVAYDFPRKAKDITLFEVPVQLIKFAMLSEDQVPANSEMLVGQINLEILPAYPVANNLAKGRYVAEVWQVADTDLAIAHVFPREAKDITKFEVPEQIMQFAEARNGQIPANEMALVEPMKLEALPGYAMFSGVAEQNYMMAWQAPETTIAYIPPARGKITEVTIPENWFVASEQRVPANTQTLVSPFMVEFFPTYRLYVKLSTVDYLPVAWRAPTTVIAKAPARKIIKIAKATPKKVVEVKKAEAPLPEKKIARVEKPAEVKKIAKVEKPMIEPKVVAVAGKAEVGAAGGVIVAKVPNGEVDMDIPKNVMTDSSKITVRSVANIPELKVGKTVGPIWDLGPSGQKFDDPIMVKFHYKQADVPVGIKEEDLMLCSYSGDKWEWVSRYNVDAENNYVVAWISHFSLYRIVWPETSNVWNMSFVDMFFLLMIVVHGLFGV